METGWKIILEQQFGASVDMLERALFACTDTLWGDRTQRPEYWYLVYHTLFTLDRYLSRAVKTLPAPAPFALRESNAEEPLPERPYTKEEITSYLEHGRQKARAAFELLAAEQARAHRSFAPGELSVFELLVYNTRHIQHHTAQLYLMLRRHTDSTPGWVGKGSTTETR